MLSHFEIWVDIQIINHLINFKCDSGLVYPLFSIQVFDGVLVQLWELGLNCLTAGSMSASGFQIGSTRVREAGRQAAAWLVSW